MLTTKCASAMAVPYLIARFAVVKPDRFKSAFVSFRPNQTGNFPSIKPLWQERNSFARSVRARAYTQVS
jgi:hypothetical protein